MSSYSKDQENHGGNSHVDSKESTVEKILSSKSRVQDPKQRGELTFNFFIWLISSITITVATGVYLWAKDKNETCIAPNSMADRAGPDTNWVDVSRRFRDILKIFFAVAIADVFRSCLMLVAVLCKIPALATLYQALIINDVLGFGAIFVLHVFRFSLSGEICAGDHKDDRDNYPYNGDLLESQGAYLIGLVCWVWIGGIILCLISTCLTFCRYQWVRQTLLGKLVNGWKSISLIHRLEKNNQNDLILIQFFFQAVQALAIFCAVAAFLWSKEVESTCLAPYSKNGPTTIVKVHERFRDVLKIWWTVSLIDFFRSLFALAATAANKSESPRTSKFFAWLYQILVINDVFLIGAILILHAYRFQYSGQWCSGDFLDVQSASRNGYLIARGQILVGLVIYTWVGLAVYTCLMTCLITAASRRFNYSTIQKIQRVALEDDATSEAVSDEEKPYDTEIHTTILACSAAQLGQTTILEKMMQNGVQLAAGDYDLRTPLHIAAAAGQLKAIEVLLRNADVLDNINCQDRWGATPLDDVKPSDVQIRDLLEEHGAVQSGKKQKYKPMRPQNLNDDNYRLYYAAYHDDVGTMQVLNKLEGFRVNSYDYDGRTALHIAASEGNFKAIEFLLSLKANPLQKDSRGNTAIDDAERLPDDSIENRNKKEAVLRLLRNAKNQEK